MDQKWTALLEDIAYDMTHQKRGRAILINNENFDNHKQRKGTDVDAKRIQKCFIELGFEVVRKNDKKVSEMMNLLEKESQRDHSTSDCLVVIILSHGEEGRVFGTDYAVHLDQLTTLFDSTNCPSLAGKPKLFFIQACRGTDFDDGVVVKSDDEPDGIGMDSHGFALDQDFLLAFATVNGYYSWRNRKNGSWFIQALCDVFSRHSNTLDLLSMMTRVNNSVAFTYQSSQSTGGKKQIPCMISKLTKDLYFTPKSKR
ncbi:caspase-7-like [Ptychodera flava]|uniref:caspase-7-like n=1 Tax=Ptychodera flava TaxID=63121 RepID=UPI00396A53F2